MSPFPASTPSPSSPSARVPVGWRWLVIGMVLALVFTLTPTLGFMGWLFGSLFHETGHVVFAWFVGCPAFPAISLAGHAAAFHKAQSPMIVLLMGGLLVAFAVWAWREGRLRGLATTLLVLWPLLTFVDGLRDLGFLLSGHLGELTFAAVFLVRARTGIATENEAERPLYACLGWFLVARNVALTAGLVFSAQARARYMGNGSFGMRNDYTRVAQDVLHVSLPAVAGAMLLVSLAVVPLVLWLTRNAQSVDVTPRPFPSPQPSPLKWEAVAPPAAGSGDPTPPRLDLPPPTPAAPPVRRTIPISKVRR